MKLLLQFSKSLNVEGVKWTIFPLKRHQTSSLTRRPVRHTCIVAAVEAEKGQNVGNQRELTHRALRDNTSWPLTPGLTGSVRLWIPNFGSATLVLSVCKKFSKKFPFRSWRSQTPEATNSLTECLRISTIQVNLLNSFKHHSLMSSI